MVKREKIIEGLLKFGIAVATIFLINAIVSKFPLRIDLTEDKRYTISEASKSLLRNLDDVVYVDVYLEGEFPSGFKRLQQSIRETLVEFKIYAGSNLQYQFIDPDQAKGKRAQNEFAYYLNEKGIQPTDLFVNENGKRITKRIFPGAVVAYGGKETGAMFLKGNKGAGPEEQLNQSVEGVEYELASAIRSLSKASRKKIAIIEGHNELDSMRLLGFANVLKESFGVNFVNIRARGTLAGYEMAVVARPTRPYTDKEKYVLDQFIVGGGKALFFIDAMQVNMDSASNEGTIAIPYQQNLDDLLFRYGVRVNKDFVQDLNSGGHPVVVGNRGNQPDIRMLPWPFYPLINTYGQSPIVKNLDAVSTKFISSMDTVKADGIKKTALLFSSPYSRKLRVPVRVSLNDLRDIVPENFQGGETPLAFLLEGKFTSLYKNRIKPDNADESLHIDAGQDSKIIVVGDADVVRNDVNFQTGEALALGEDPFAQTKYANSDFVVNAVQYMLDEGGIITARNKEVKIRPLDKIKVENERSFWQVLNLGLPLLIVLLYGIGRYYWRKRKYAKF